MAGEDLRAKEEVAIVHRTFEGEMVRNADVLEHVLGVPVSKQRQDHGKRLAIVMRLPTPSGTPGLDSIPVGSIELPRATLLF